MKKAFTARYNLPRLSAEEAARQGKAAQRAIVTLGSIEAVRFLNAFDETLDGRPIDLAVASAEGLAAVETLLDTKTTD